MARLVAAGERFDVVAGVSSGSVCAALTVAGLAARGPDIARDFAGAPIVSTRYLDTERSVFGVRRILFEVLHRNLPEERLLDTEAELLIATTHAGAYARHLVPAHVDVLTSSLRRTLAAPVTPRLAMLAASVAPRLTTLAASAAHRLGEGLGGRMVGERGDAPPLPPLVIHSNRERRDLHDILMASCYIPVLYAGVARLDGALHVDGALADNTLLDALSARGATEITVVTPFVDAAVARTMFSPGAPLAPRPGVRLRVLYPERPLSIGRFDFSRERLEEALSMPHRERIIEPIASGHGQT